MDTITVILETAFGFLLKFLELFVAFSIGALNLLLDFARALGNLVL